MNIFIKNCKVDLFTGTETMNISGEHEQTNEPDTGVVSTQRTYTLEGFLANKAAVQIGDRVRLPAFTIPAVKMDGDEVMQFDRQDIKADEAVVIGREENGDFILVFDHCLFESAIDLNGEKRFEMTQLGQYLQGEFRRAMNNAGIPAENCGLLSNEEMFGDNPLEYFKDGRNRIAFDFDDDCSRCYWLSSLYDEEASATYFCNACTGGRAACNTAGYAYVCVRPRFVIHKS